MRAACSWGPTTLIMTQCRFVAPCIKLVLVHEWQKFTYSYPRMDTRCYHEHSICSVTMCACPCSIMYNIYIYIYIHKESPSLSHPCHCLSSQGFRVLWVLARITSRPTRAGRMLMPTCIIWHIMFHAMISTLLSLLHYPYSSWRPAPSSLLGRC